MMMVETGDADAFLAGTYSAAHSVGKIAREVIGIRPSYNHFATLHIVNTKRGTFFIADTQVNKTVDEDTLVDIARLTRNSVEYFSHEPVIAMVSYSNFGSGREEECLTVRAAVERMQRLYPELAIDGEMGLNYALNRDLRDTTFPFNKLNGQDVNALIFPNLSAATTAFRTMLEMGLGDAIGPIQMGLNKPVHFISVNAGVRDIINLATIASLDAAVLERNATPIDK